MLERLWKPEEAAEFLGVSEKTVLRYVREKKLSSVGLDAKNIRFTKAQMDAFVESHTRSAEPKRIDTLSTRRLPYLPKEVKKSSGDSVKAQLRKEIAQW